MLTLRLAALCTFLDCTAGGLYRQLCVACYKYRAKYSGINFYTGNLRLPIQVTKLEAFP